MEKFMKWFDVNYPFVAILLILGLIGFLLFCDHESRKRFYEACDPIHGHEECKLMYMAGGHDP